MPGDLLAHLLAAHLGPLDELISAHLIEGGGGPSRGSLRSVLAIRDALRSSAELTYRDGAWLPGVPAARDEITFPGDDEPTRVVGFPLQEVVSVPRHVRVRRVQSVAEAALAAPITPAMIEGLPDGPPEAERQKQRFTIVIDAISMEGEVARGVDTYGTTAVIAAEAARRLVVGVMGTAGKSIVRPGVRAPAEAFDPADFLDWLAPHGLSWSIK
ncbi:MAG TPA: hypothetical protein VGM10_19455 [Actinocrinis sp.]